MPACIVTGKKPISGFNVSHSNRHTKRWLFPAVSKRRLLNPATGRYVTVFISNRGLRTLKKWDTEGKKYDLAQMKADCE
jgi:large subunit ribosomal protein L28